MLALLGALPVIGNIVTGLTTAFFNAKVQIMQAKTGLAAEQAKQIVSAAVTEDHERSSRLATIASNTILTLLVVFFALPFGLYIWKIVCVDVIIGPGCLWFTKICWIGTTDPIRGQVADWANTIIAAIFGASTAVTISKMILAKKLDD